MQITVEGETLELQRAKIKNLYLRVYPDGRAVVRAPMRVPKAQIEAFVRARIPWLRAQKKKLRESGGVRQAEFADGRRLWLFGESFTLRVRHAGKPGLIFSGGEAVLTCPEDADDAAKRAIVCRTYAALLSPYLAARIEYFAPRMGVKPTGAQIRYMASRWGSCTPASGRMRFNLRLAQKPEAWIDSVIVHELAHLRHADHSRDFWALVEAFAPEARAIGRRMNKGEYEAL